MIGLRRGDIVIGRAISPKIFDHIWRLSVRELARFKNERPLRCGHIMTEKHLQVLLQVIVYDCTISGDIFARQPSLTKVNEYAYRTQLLMSVYIEMKASNIPERSTKYFWPWNLSWREGKKVCKFYHVE